MGNTSMSAGGVPWSYNDSNSMSTTGWATKTGGGGLGTGLPGGIEEDAVLRQQKIEKQRQMIEARAQKKRQMPGLMQPSERALSARSRPRTAGGLSTAKSHGLHVVTPRTHNRTNITATKAAITFNIQI
ncbi:uncharacterized protein LOC143038545 isoform X2 [Oratosquilla oratoria]|uniref:uncharacterized protein LOC143038545 isoform X2 n=1 Tax=Oratosquilla oratoria TaxID=337810 RepID=UPI003F761BD7